MSNGWAYVGPTSRWTTIWITKEGHIGLNAFTHGAWSITDSDKATEDNPHGIVASSWENGPMCSTLGDAMAAAEEAATAIGAIPVGEKQEQDNG